MMDQLLAQAQNLIQTFTPLHWAILSAVIVLCILIPILSRRARRRRRQRFAPQLVLEVFQISPLGRDAFLKIKNNGETATFTSLFVRGRRDIVFRNALAGHELEKGKTYSILLEATAQELISPNFSIEITYFDQMRNVYRQTFNLANNSTRAPKLVQPGR
ncbi:MAG TPA: hypothetical protein PKC76_15275 [Saprospiraceae bacterium]|nr:hypothetical protein [Saprospiraceae bacterium]HMP25496.1 hypothetical protein [Saprospiraceae bacterium]